MGNAMGHGPWAMGMGLEAGVTPPGAPRWRCTVPWAATYKLQGHDCDGRVVCSLPGHLTPSLGG